MPEAALPPPEQAHAKPEPARAGAAIFLSLALAVTGLALFAFIAGEVFLRHSLAFDNSVRSAIHAVASPNLTRLMRALSFVGSPAFVIVAYLLAIGIFLSKKWRRAAAWITVSLVGGTILDTALKLAFHRARPIAFVGISPNTFSFPSGHALGSVCFYGLLAALIAARIHNFWLRALAWAVGVALVVGIGISRIYLGVHYPTDVAAGYAAAAFWVATLVWLDRYRARRRGLLNRR